VSGNAWITGDGDEAGYGRVGPEFGGKRVLARAAADQQNPHGVDICFRVSNL
jgi:hypothetical protein